MNHKFAIIRRHWYPLLSLNSVIMIATILSATVLASIFSPPVWKARARLNIPASGGNLNADLGPLGSLRDSTIGFSKEVSPLQVQASIIRSDAVLEDVLAADSDKEAFPGLGSYRGLFEVIPQPQSSIISIEAHGSSTELAVERATNLVKFYQQRLNELRRQDADFRQQFSHKELETARQDLIDAQKELEEFSQATGIVDSGAQTQQLVSSISELKTRLTTIEAEADASQTQAEIAATYLKTTPEQAINSLRLADNKEYQEVREQLAQTEIELNNARSQYTDASPQVQALLLKRQQLTEELAQRITTAIPDVDSQSVDQTIGGDGSTRRLDMISGLINSQTTSKGLQQQTTQIQNQIDRLNAELNSISRNKTRLAELQRKYDIAEGVYKGIVAQVNQAKINNFNSYPNVQLIDGPTLDPKPEKPSRKVIVLGGMMASMFGSISLLFFLESRAPLLSPRDLQLVEFPVLISVAYLKHLSSEWDMGLGWQQDVTTEREFERLATAFKSLVLENNRIMITSANSGEGKTTITLGLALALAKLGFHILVVDGDLKRANLSHRLGITQAELEANGQITPTPIAISPGLDLVPAPPIPKDEIGQFFARGSFEQHLNLAQENRGYDYVLVDTAPVNLTSETTLMSSVMQNVLFVVRPGVSDRYSVMSSLEQLKQHKAQIKGLVVNGVDSPHTGYRYGNQQELLEAAS